MLTSWRGFFGLQNIKTFVLYKRKKRAQRAFSFIQKSKSTFTKVEMGFLAALVTPYSLPLPPPPSPTLNGVTFQKLVYYDLPCTQ